MRYQQNVIRKILVHVKITATPGWACGKTSALAVVAFPTGWAVTTNLETKAMVAFLLIIGFVSIALLTLLPFVAMAVVQRASTEIHGGNQACARESSSGLMPWTHLGGRMQPSRT